ncbi:hypothetical protein OB919_16100 [Halobacteria archaeon AArc-curdl1]|uniref:C2H2-type domain-containing protein n=1 Tax=Natronosalvus hydrolyticus TaxID=2979988 RepID=A0AAP2ZAT0_9EURY|nr:hypothetical protein [Halobacteria archaeon AArc-curdl1]
MTATVHRVWSYRPMLVEEATVFEDGELRIGDIEETKPLNLPEIQHDRSYFECECGKCFDTKESAKSHLQKVRSQE